MAGMAFGLIGLGKIVLRAEATDTYKDRPGGDEGHCSSNQETVMSGKTFKGRQGSRVLKEKDSSPLFSVSNTLSK